MLTFAFGLAISVSPLAALGRDQEPALPAAAAGAQAQSGVRAGFWWADYDRDGLDDAFVVGADGAARLLRNLGDGSFADVTLLSGLDGLGAASFAAWNDYDRDGAPDVFVGTQSGPGHLMRNAGDGTFQDVTQFVGLTHSGRHIAAQWFDYDLDGSSDLSVRTDSGEQLYHALSNGHFELVDLGSVKPPLLGASAASIDISAALDADPSAPAASQKPSGKQPPGRVAAHASPGSNNTAGATTRFTPATPLPPPGTWLISACPPKLADSANNNCLQASSVPTLGMLYPLSINLNVNGAGNVGIGTTTPAAKLDVAGTARVGDTLILNPAGDQALNVSTGSIYKGGALFIHTKGGTANTAIGRQALGNVSSGAANTASGFLALYNNTGGYFNTASGHVALYSNTTGSYNTANGNRALYSNSTGFANTANGSGALASNTSGTGNTASGNGALYSNSTGYSNTAAGGRALQSNTIGSNNTASGYQALLANTTGYSNTASGSRALRANTTGAGNTADGYEALSANTTGIFNTAIGQEALSFNTTGYSNTACGVVALQGNTSGFLNTAVGGGALRLNTSGRENTASGFYALRGNTSGYHNTASGSGALRTNGTGRRNSAFGVNALQQNTTGYSNFAGGMYAMQFNTTGFYNTAVGYRALEHSTSGRNNIAIGKDAGAFLTTGNLNIAIGNPGVAGEGGTIRLGDSSFHGRAFIAGIRGVTTGVANAIPVVVDSNGQLGTVSSSRRFKQDIVDMGDATENLLKLRPVRFRYKQEQTLPDGSEVPMEYGLIAEEVAEIFPDLVVYGDDGKPFTVKYHILSSMLLNEMEKQATEVKTQALEVNAQRLKLEEQSVELQKLRERLGALEARTAAATLPAGSR